MNEYLDQTPWSADSRRNESSRSDPNFSKIERGVSPLKKIFRRTGTTLDDSASFKKAFSLNGIMCLETTIGTGVAGWACRLDLDKKSVVVAISVN
jgi:hypothetical protein